jgi:flagellar M-ring protein FliF
VLGSDFFVRLRSGLQNLGARRVILLGLIGLVVFGGIAAMSYVLGKPQREALYTNLELQDISQIGSVLEESGISFDVNAEGTAVLVDHGMAAKARMILAEKGLPKSDKAGYELFDNLGSMGLTSFMQQVTKVRALEGELARTIQLIKGVKAARVHLVMPQEASFRSLKEAPSASVVVRADSNDGKAFAPAIQQLVAAAIPGMTRDMVSVLNTDGTILAAAGQGEDAGPSNMVSLERELASDIEARIGMTLMPSLGAGNFRVSVAAKLNTDQRQVNETVFDPESRVERSVRAVKELGETKNKSGSQAVSVDQNIPTETTPTAAGGDQSSEKNDKREETTNYEINQKQVETKSNGYVIDQLSVAVVVNKAQITKLLGDKATPEEMSAQLKELEGLASSAAGLIETRGDKLKITAINFLDDASSVEAAAGEPVMDIFTRNLGTIINSAALVIVTLLVLLLGLKPALRAIVEAQAPASADVPATMLQARSAVDAQRIGEQAPQLIAQAPQDTIQGRLEQIIERDSEKAAQILKEWLAEPPRSAA